MENEAMNWRTPVAKAVVWVGGQLMRIKYPQKTYRWLPLDEREPDWRETSS